MIGAGQGPGRFRPRSPSTDLIAELYAAYEKRLAASGALDFDDLLVRTARLLRDDAGAPRAARPPLPLHPGR